MGFLSRTYRPNCGMFEPPVKGKGDVITPPHDTIDWAHQRMIGHINADPAEKRLPSAVLKIRV